LPTILSTGQIFNASSGHGLTNASNSCLLADSSRRLFVVSECKQLVRGLKPNIDNEIEFGRLYNWEGVT
jgi:hypothetical protein